ncbi:hypothetical protein C7M84_005198 [Penaeus vannamei]|uniref:Uncharacterized protein n=1 Tax=Penaeus vannamei TaxID=6689 RepID=A0A423UAZ7_PENVA|nr:hypothetical protein C7M84_005198 [Penaeus vannamei]
MAEAKGQTHRISLLNIGNVTTKSGETHQQRMAGVDGRHCLLRVICDVAEAPFDQGLMGELLNTLLTASLAGRPDDGEHDRDYDHYIEAELHGKLNGKCEERYSKCKISPFDLIPNAIHTVA